MFKNIYEEIAYKFKHLPGLKPKSVKNNPYFNASVNDEFVHNLNPDRYNFYMNFMRALADPEVVKNVIYENNLIKVDQEEQSKLVENIIGKLGDLYQLDEYEKKQIINTEIERKKNTEKTSKIVDRISDILTDTSTSIPKKDDIKQEVGETFKIFATGVNYDKMEREIEAKTKQKTAKTKPEEAKTKPEEAKEKNDVPRGVFTDANGESRGFNDAFTNANGESRGFNDVFTDANGESRGFNDAFTNANGESRGFNDAFTNANGESRGFNDAFTNANGGPMSTDDDASADDYDVPRGVFTDVNGESRGFNDAFTNDAMNLDNYLKDSNDALIEDGILENKIKQVGGDGDKINPQTSVFDLAEQTKTKIKESIQKEKTNFKENTDLWNKKKELDRIREDTNKSDSDKAEELKKEIDDIEGDGIMSIKRLEVSREDRLVFIGLTFLLRIVVLTLIEWSLNTNFILTFTNAFLLYICVYSILFVIIIIIVNITYNYPIMDLYTGNHGIFTSMASSLYYFYLIPGSESKHLVRLGVHLGFIIFLTMIAILIKGNEEKNNEGLNYDYAVKRNIKRVINDFTMLLWIFTSIIAMYMI
jgi:hypothetical protein